MATLADYGPEVRAEVKQVREVAPSKGWNESNCQIEFYQWRRFNGISGRFKAAA